MLSKKHYKAIAEIISQELDFATTIDGHCPNCKYRIKTLAENLADYFEEDNPRFDRQKFLRACELL